MAIYACVHTCDIHVMVTGSSIWAHQKGGSGKFLHGAKFRGFCGLDGYCRNNNHKTLNSDAILWWLMWVGVVLMEHPLPVYFTDKYRVKVKVHG